MLGVPRFITRTGRETAEDATQIFGGRGLTVTGMGKLVENVSLRSVICDDRSTDM